MRYSNCIYQHRYAHCWSIYRGFVSWCAVHDCPNVPGESSSSTSFRLRPSDFVQAEISPPHARGLLSGMTQWMISWGFFIANWVGYGCGFLKNKGQFRVPLGIQIIPAALLLVCVSPVAKQETVTNKSLQGNVRPSLFASLVGQQRSSR